MKFLNWARDSAGSATPGPHHPSKEPQTLRMDKTGQSKTKQPDDKLLQLKRLKGN